ncbi:MAG: hypothetical protein IKZ82_14255 [Clostridia bacterium]|nr:hypothetical protein [Clostridia bacterium]
MKKAYQLIPLIIALCFAAVFASLSACSCGKNDDGSPQILIDGKESAWQKLTVFVPDGMDLVGGSALDSSDPNTAWIQRRGDEMSYFLVNIVSNDRIEATIKTTKELNLGDDVEFDAGKFHWKGVKYKYAGVSDCFQVFAEVNGKTVLVSGSKFAHDSSHAMAVLGSIKLAD